MKKTLESDGSFCLTFIVNTSTTKRDERYALGILCQRTIQSKGVIDKRPGDSGYFLGMKNEQNSLSVCTTPDSVLHVYIFT